MLAVKSLLVLVIVASVTCLPRGLYDAPEYHDDYVEPAYEMVRMNLIKFEFENETNLNLKMN